MADHWSEQQLKHFIRVRDSFVKTGFSTDVAEAQARRTVEGRREPSRRSVEATKDELYREAMRYNIAGRSKMDKNELAKAIDAYRISHSDA
jgi:hypothetical protein